MQGGKRGLPVAVGGQGGQIGVVHPLHQTVVASAAEPGAMILIAAPQRFERLRFGRFRGRILVQDEGGMPREPSVRTGVSLGRNSGSIRRTSPSEGIWPSPAGSGRVGLGVEDRQAGLGPHEEAGEPTPLRLSLPVRRELIGPALDGKPLAGARLAHEAGKGFVQRHVIGHPEPAVGRLMDQQFGQFGLRPIDEGAQQRIVEPAERGIGGDPADVGLQTLARQALRGADGGIAREVAPIGGAAGKWMAPLTGRQ